MSSDPLLTSGERFVDRYIIEEMIGKGGFSQVFRARNPNGQTVAVKVLLPQEGQGKRSYPDSLVDRFVREARLLERLKDPFTIDLYDHGRSPGGHLFMVFEYLQGRELFDIIKNDGPQPYARVAHVLRQTLKALQAAHALGILHRDIKPNNIMIVRQQDGSERVKVLDFGIAKMYGDSANTAGNDLTAAGVLVGTPRYMSPEQLRSGQLGPASDIYSLGIVAIEMLTGRKAIRGRDRIDIIQQQLSPTPFQIPHDVSCPVDLRRVILRMVEKNVHARYQSAAQVLRDLEAWSMKANEGRTIVEVVKSPELHAPPRAETAQADEDTNVHRISVAALDAVDKGPPPSARDDATIAESDIDTHSRPSLQAKLRRDGGFPDATSETFDRIDTGPGLEPPQTDMSSSDLDATMAASHAHGARQDLDRTLAHNPLRAAADAPSDELETVEASAFRPPASTSSSGLGWPKPAGDDLAETVEQHAMSREQLRAAAEALNAKPGGAGGISHERDAVSPLDRPTSFDTSNAFDLTPTSPRAQASSDLTQSAPAKGLQPNEKKAIIVSVFLPGAGHIMLGQKNKGIAILVALVLTVGLLYLVALAVAFDAFLVVRASRRREVGPWEFFPDFGELLS
jgi:serine/threonine protein kinase